LSEDDVVTLAVTVAPSSQWKGSMKVSSCFVIVPEPLSARLRRG
jgi:hypothetical protein